MKNKRKYSNSELSHKLNLRTRQGSRDNETVQIHLLHPMLISLDLLYIVKYSLTDYNIKIFKYFSVVEYNQILSVNISSWQLLFALLFLIQFLLDLLKDFQ